MTADASYDHIIIGGGAMGSATAWQLARAGRSVLLIERFAQLHAHGASHGASRNFNIAYTEPDYLDLVAEAGYLWRTLEAETDTHLLDLVGLVNHGAGEPEHHDELLHQHGFSATTLTPHEAQERWPGIRFDTRVTYTPDGGRLNPDRAIPALQAAAVRHDAEFRYDTAVRAVEVAADGQTVRVSTDDATYSAPSLVVTAGAWAHPLLDGLVALPPLRVTQEQPAHFALTTAGAVDGAAALVGVDEATQALWPGFNHLAVSGDHRTDWWYSDVYGMLTPGEGVKAGWHGTGPVVDPDHRSYQPEPRQLAALQRYVREWLPGADPDRLVPVSCTYTTTPDEDFVVDRRGPIVVGAGFSGHGFKFTPAVGRMLADHALNADARPMPRFALSRFGL